MTGQPSYVELGVPDVDAAYRFYGSLLGWTPPAGPGGQVDTETLSIGIHGHDAEKHFEVFFAVDDLAASIDEVVELGGEVLGDINDSGDFGLWVECRDDQGVRFGLREAHAAEHTLDEDVNDAADQPAG
jgi:uncharacterized protein